MSEWGLAEWSLLIAAIVIAGSSLYRQGRDGGKPLAAADRVRWWPIETAPDEWKDGRDMLGAWRLPDWEMHVVYFDGENWRRQMDEAHFDPPDMLSELRPPDAGEGKYGDSHV